jgi:type II secretory pathway pseudopilin PulG
MLFFSHKLQKTQIRAFTLVETLVSIMIITSVILGPLTIAMGASAYARQTKDTMTALYLAQEAIELLRHQQDSVFLRCIGGTGSSCPFQPGETSSEAAWRIFHDRLAGNSYGPSCFDTDTPAGCAYDFKDMTTNEDFSPTKYPFAGNSCATLSISPEGLYVCTGVHGAGYLNSSFARSVSITSTNTFNGTDASYNNDLRITVSISFKRANGYSRTIKVVDFLHARA